jgi:hypothetical protein
MANIYVNYPEVAEGAPIEVPPYGVLANGTSSLDEVNAATLNWLELQNLNEDLYLPPGDLTVTDTEGLVVTTDTTGNEEDN